MGSTLVGKPQYDSSTNFNSGLMPLLIVAFVGLIVGDGLFLY